MQNLTSRITLDEQKILEQINRIVLLRIKTLIVENLKKEDIPEFRQIIEKNDPKLLFSFANKKIPDLAGKIHEEIKRLTMELKKGVHNGD